jgi:hypothetical protein
MYRRKVGYMVLREVIRNSGSYKLRFKSFYQIYHMAIMNKLLNCLNFHKHKVSLIINLS